MNLAYIDSALSRVAGTGNYDHEDEGLYFTPDDLNIGELVDAVFDNYVLPELQRWSPNQLSRLQLALRYVLTFDRDSLDRLFVTKVSGNLGVLGGQKREERGLNS